MSDVHPQSARTPAAWFGVFARGAAMGVAEVIPGVSGGTIAFISGIYNELLDSIARFGPASLLQWRRDGFAATWQAHNASFLLVLGLGMLAALLSVARVVSHLLDAMPPVVWGFFFGLILASVVVIGRRLPWRSLLLWGLPGALCGALLGSLQAFDVAPAAWMFIPGGMLAVTAWILPGISGSFLLLLFGLYAGFLAALDSLHWPVLLCMGIGCALGLLLFTRALRWLLQHYYVPVLAFLTGIMAGSLLRLWPWRDAVEAPLLPAVYAGDPHLLLTLAMLVVGVVAVFWLDRLGPATRS